MSGLQTVDSPQVSLVREWIGAFAGKDLNVLAKHLHKDYRFIFYPRSLGKSPVAREEWLEHIRKMTGRWVETDVSCGSFHSILRLPPINSLSQATFHSIIDAPGKVVAHVRVQKFKATTVR